MLVVASVWIISLVFLLTEAVRVGPVSDLGLGVANLLVNALLSGTLIYLYREQRNVAEEQASIMSRQQEIMELEYTPRIVVTEESIQERRDIELPNNDTLVLELINNGNGAATDLHYLLDVWVRGPDIDGLDELNPVEYDGEDRVLQSALCPVSRKGVQRTENTAFRGSTLAADSSGTFFGGIQFSAQTVDEDGSEKISFSKAIEVLSETDAESMHFGVYLIYLDELDNIHADMLFGGHIVDINDHDWNRPKTWMQGTKRASDDIIIKKAKELNPYFVRDAET
jgi:hypothetical protein